MVRRSLLKWKENTSQLTSIACVFMCVLLQCGNGGDGKKKSA